MQDAASPRMSIAVPSPDLEALTKTCMDLKQAVEQMAGRYEVLGARSRMTVSDTPPKIERDGEFWLSEGTSNVLSVSYQGKWRLLAPLTP